MELSGEFPVKALCEEMSIVRSSFYGWKKRLSHPSEREKSFVFFPSERKLVENLTGFFQGIRGSRHPLIIVIVMGLCPPVQQLIESLPVFINTCA